MFFAFRSTGNGPLRSVASVNALNHVVAFGFSVSDFNKSLGGVLDGEFLRCYLHTVDGALLVISADPVAPDHSIPPLPRPSAAEPSVARCIKRYPTEEESFIRKPALEPLQVNGRSFSDSDEPTFLPPDDAA